jgi:hypothetical protein
VGTVLDIEKSPQGASQGDPIRFDLAKQVGGLAVVLSARAKPQSGAACGIGCGNAGENSQGGRHIGRCEVVVYVENEFGSVQERTRMGRANPGLIVIALR